MSAKLTILGLGPGNPRQRTEEAAVCLAAASRIVLRTGIHPGLADLVNDPRVSTCDDLYDDGGTFDEVYEAIVQRVLAMAADGDVVFAVPGHPLIGERTVSSILRMAPSAGIAVALVPGVSALDVVASALAVDPMAREAQLIDATELQRFIEREPFNGGMPDVSPTRPVLLSQLYSTPVAVAAKLTLGRVFPDEHPVQVVTAAGVDGAERVIHARLFELDRVAVDHLSSAWIPPLAELDASRGPLTLHRIAARLRAPGGCPWDRAQTHESLRRTVLDEAYEVVDAIDEGDADHLAEELGDLVLHVAMQAQIADEAGDFSIGDVWDHVNRKLVRRHPHVFGDVEAGTPDAVVQTWDAVKAAERAAKGESERPADPFDRLPRSMPVLHRVASVARTRVTTIDTAVLTSIDDAGDELISIVERLISMGADPELELERAYRRRNAGGDAAS